MKIINAYTLTVFENPSEGNGLAVMNSWFSESKRLDEGAFKMTLGKEIARLRLEKGLRQIDLAGLVGVHQTHMARWENDQMRPRKAMLGKLAKALDVSVDDLLAADQREFSSQLLQEQEPELAEMLRQLHILADDERTALKTFLKSMLSRAHMEQAMTLALNRPPGGATKKPDSEPGRVRVPRSPKPRTARAR